MFTGLSAAWAQYAIATLALTSFIQGIEAKQLAPLPSLKSGTTANEKLLHVPFKAKRSSRHPNKRSPDHHLKKRADEEGTLQVDLDNYLTYYNIEFGLGTPSQQFNLLIDTGSSDLWVIDESNSYCTDDAREISEGTGINCTISGVFDQSESSTYSRNSSDFFISYGDSTVAEGDWATDTMTLDDHKITAMSFGLGLTTNSSMGVLGIGYPSNEATAILDSPYAYANLPFRLVQEGIINTPAYSLWLNDANSDEGNILFGAVDHDKYSGDLVSMDIQIGSTRFSEPYAFYVELTDLSQSTNGDSESILPETLLALLDSGTSLSYFPSSIASTIFSNLEASYSSSLGYYVTACDTEGSLDYEFGDAKITVPYSSLMIPITDDSGRSATLRNGDAACAVGIQAAEYSFALLGDTFLRNAYVVYDMGNDKIAMAQAAANVTSSNIEVISDAIPSTPPNHSPGQASSAAFEETTTTRDPLSTNAPDTNTFTTSFDDDESSTTSSRRSRTTSSSDDDDVESTTAAGASATSGFGSDSESSSASSTAAAATSSSGGSTNGATALIQVHPATFALLFCLFSISTVATLL